MIYQRHGFRLVSPEEKDRLLDAYWSIPPRQRETSVVLIHGMLNSSSHWRSVALALADEYTVIAPDLIGMGDYSHRLAWNGRVGACACMWPLCHSVAVVHFYVCYECH